MKEAIGAFVIALVLSCVFNGFFLEAPPYPSPVGLSGVKETGLGVKRAEGDIPEILYTDGARTTAYMTKIDEKSEDRDVEFPLGANN